MGDFFRSGPIILFVGFFIEHGNWWSRLAKTSGDDRTGMPGKNRRPAGKYDFP